VALPFAERISRDESGWSRDGRETSINACLPQFTDTFFNFRYDVQNRGLANGNYTIWEMFMMRETFDMLKMRRIIASLNSNIFPVRNRMRIRRLARSGDMASSSYRSIGRIQLAKVELSRRVFLRST